MTSFEALGALGVTERNAAVSVPIAGAPITSEACRPIDGGNSGIGWYGWHGELSLSCLFMHSERKKILQNAECSKRM